MCKRSVRGSKTTDKELRDNFIFADFGEGLIEAGLVDGCGDGHNTYGDVVASCEVCAGANIASPVTNSTEAMLVRNEIRVFAMLFSDMMRSSRHWSN